MKKDLLTIGDLSSADIKRLFDLTDRIKKNPRKFSSVLKGKSLALIFQKPSNRTYVSFNVGMFELGGTALYLGPDQINLGVRESVNDVARTLSRYVDGIVLRTFSHETVLEMAQYATVPVINGLSDYSHPCQALADLFTLQERFRKIKGLTFAYIGDGNNVCNSLIFVCSKLGVNINIASPHRYVPDTSVIRQGEDCAKKSGSRITVFKSPKEAARGAHVLYTDVWTSMGQEEESAQRKKDFEGFQINDALISVADKKVCVMHCLPARRGEEISNSAIEGKHSVVFDEAENRLHVQKAVLVTLLKNKRSNLK
jgi:ornithine carbamoyltransferase